MQYQRCRHQDRWWLYYTMSAIASESQFSFLFIASPRQLVFILPNRILECWMMSCLVCVVLVDAWRRLYVHACSMVALDLLFHSSPGTATPETSRHIFINSSCLSTLFEPGCGDSSPLVVKNAPDFSFGANPSPSHHSANTSEHCSVVPGAERPPILVEIQPGCILTLWISHRLAKALASIVSCSLLLP